MNMEKIKGKERGRRGELSREGWAGREGAVG